MAKLRQKISDGFRTTEHAHSLATLRTAIHTAGTHGWNVLETPAIPIRRN